MSNSNVRYSLAEIAAKLSLDLQMAGTNDQAEKLMVSGVATLAGASNTQIGFLANKRYQSQLAQTKALAVILHPSMAEHCHAHCLLAKDPYLAYAKLTQLFAPMSADAVAVHANAVVHPEAKLGERVRIGAGVVIGANAIIGNDTQINANAVVEHDVVVGNDSVIRSNATLCYGVRLGSNVTVQAGAVVGGEGFGFAPEVGEQGTRAWQKIAQLGTVVVGDRVEIGSNTTIDRGALDNTVIEDDVIIDNQVQIAHNVVIGAGTAIAGCVGIAGSAKIGKRCNIGGGAGIAGHLSIADDTTVMGMTLINKSVTKAGAYASGTGMQEASSWRRSAVRFTQLEDMQKRLRALEMHLKSINEIKK